MCLRTGLDTAAKRKILSSCRESNPLVQAVVWSLYWLYSVMSINYEILRYVIFAILLFHAIQIMSSLCSETINTFLFWG
jgi:hypothetical protein